MSRAPLDYRENRPSAHAVDAYAVATPAAGYYRARLVSGGHAVGIRIWHGAPLDPVTGEELDRGHRWQATANGKPIDLDRVWPGCGRDPITKAEHDHLADLEAWGAANAPAGPQANPRKRVDMVSAPLPF